MEMGEKNKSVYISAMYCSNQTSVPVPGLEKFKFYT